MNLYGRSVIPLTGQWPDVAPVTIVRLDRWVAFPMSPDQVPEAHAEPDFLARYAEPYGAGDSPDAAYLDLARRLSR